MNIVRVDKKQFILALFGKDESNYTYVFYLLLVQCHIESCTDTPMTSRSGNR